MNGRAASLAILLIATMSGMSLWFMTAAVLLDMAAEAGFGEPDLAWLSSGAAAVLTAIAFGGPVWLTFALIVIWGAAVVPDSPQFSALVADHAPPELAGSLLTFQASLGFLMTTITVQAAPSIAEALGWPAVLALLALGPAFGLWGMRPVLHAPRHALSATPD